MVQSSCAQTPRSGRRIVGPSSPVIHSNCLAIRASSVAFRLHVEVSFHTGKRSWLLAVTGPPERFITPAHEPQLPCRVHTESSSPTVFSVSEPGPIWYE